MLGCKAIGIWCFASSASGTRTPSASRSSSTSYATRSKKASSSGWRTAGTPAYPTRILPGSSCIAPEPVRADCAPDPPGNIPRRTSPVPTRQHCRLDRRCHRGRRRSDNFRPALKYRRRTASSGRTAPGKSLVVRPPMETFVRSRHAPRAPIPLPSATAERSYDSRRRHRSS